MANGYTVTRTNYFHVKDEAKFRELMRTVKGTDDKIELWDDYRTILGGKKVFAFGTYGYILGIPGDDGNYDECSYTRFLGELQKCVADDDAIIIFSINHEKLRYVDAGAMIVTAGSFSYVDLGDESMKKARKILKSGSWMTTTVC